MTCEHLKQLNKYIKENDIEISSYDLIKVLCKKCKEQENCEYIPLKGDN